MTAYQLSGEGFVYRFRDGVRSTIPTVNTPLLPNNNPDYLAYLDWLAKGGVPLPADEQPAPDQVCTPAQGMIALYAIKRVTENDLLALIDQIPDETQRYTARIALNRATEWRRSSATVQTMADLIPLSEEDLDRLYAFAATVAV